MRPLVLFPVQPRGGSSTPCGCSGGAERPAEISDGGRPLPLQCKHGPVITGFLLFVVPSQLVARRTGIGHFAKLSGALATARSDRAMPM